MRTLFHLIIFMFMALPAWATPPMAQDFTLRNAQGENVSLADFKGRYVVLEWWNHDCPFVKKHYDSGNMQALQRKWTGQNVAWLTIGSSAAGKQGFVGPRAALRLYAEQEMASSHILHDPKGIVGRLYQAKTTPHMFVINPAGEIIYQGAIDSVPSTDAADITKAVNFVDQALTEATGGKPISMPSTSAYGCSVKY